MAMQIRFKHDAYSSDISKLRQRIRDNANRLTLEPIELIYWESYKNSYENKNVRAIMNLAFQADSRNAAPSASLYIVGFDNPNRRDFSRQGMPKAWYFRENENERALALLTEEDYFNRDRELKGDYRGFGWATTLPDISFANLKKAINDLSGYQGGPIPRDEHKRNPLLTGMAQLIIAISEAVRFDVVEEGILKALRNESYAFPAGDYSGLIHAWNKHFLCEGRRKNPPPTS